MKRFFDIIFSLAGIIILIPIYIIVSIVITIDSKGGVIYKQKGLVKMVTLLVL
nr:sugar transferase [Elizabethkingia bruuniana]